MAESIPGGAYLASDQKTWQNAAGQPLTKEQESAAKKLAAEQAEADEAAEAALQTQALASRSIVVVQAQPAPAKAKG